MAGLMALLEAILNSIEFTGENKGWWIIWAIKLGYMAESVRWGWKTGEGGGERGEEVVGSAGYVARAEPHHVSRFVPGFSLVEISDLN